MSMLRKSVALVAILALPGLLYAQPELVWSDEFDGASIDASNWEFMIGTGTNHGLPAGWGNNELQYYTDRPENAFVSNGVLHIVARQESFAGSPYTSARIRTKDKQDFLYGRMEARLQLPSTKGIWPAFWMLPTDNIYGGWAASGEIDIMESVNIATTIFGTLHHGGEWPANTSLGNTFSNGTNFGDGFHVYALEWEPDVMRWYIDGILYGAQTSAGWFSDNAPPGNSRAPFDQPFHFLLNVAVGGNFPGNPDGSSQFPQEMLVDYVRVYDLAPSVQAPFTGSPLAIPGRIESEQFDNGGQSIAYNDCDTSNNGGAFRPVEGVDIEASSEGGFNVGWMCAGEWLEYTVDVATSGNYLVQARVASNTAGGTFHLEFDTVDKTGEIVAPGTGGWQNWTTVSAVVTLDAGEQTLRFANSASTGEYNFNYLDFVLLDPADLDSDGDVDLLDFALFSDCIAGPDVLSPPAGCSVGQFGSADLDGDGDVDLSDFGRFGFGF